MATYADSGVDIKRGDELVERIKVRVTSTYGERVEAGVGGFAALFKMDGEKLLSVGTDGVGTKLKLALELNKHDTIGQDLVAMCVNDILCTGARPLFFLDYLATDKIIPDRDEKIIGGIADACRDCSMALVGGETAEMPGVYPEGTYDLAGFAVGEVNRSELFKSEDITENCVMVGLPSSGIHSNGLSLARKLIEGESEEMKLKVLTPTKLYPKVLLPLLSKENRLILGMAHITGGGLLNIPRISSSFDYYVDDVPLKGEVNQTIYPLLRDKAKTSESELYRTFNMGVGMVLLTKSPNELMDKLKEFGEDPFVMGGLKPGSGKVYLKGEDISLVD